MHPMVKQYIARRTCLLARLSHCLVRTTAEKTRIVVERVRRGRKLGKMNSVLLSARFIAWNIQVSLIFAAFEDREKGIAASQLVPT